MQFEPTSGTFDIISRKALRKRGRFAGAAIVRATPWQTHAGPKFVARAWYLATGAGDKSAKVSTPVRLTSPRNDAGQTPSPRRSATLHFQKDLKMVGKWLSGD